MGDAAGDVEPPLVHVDGHGREVVEGQDLRRELSDVADRRGRRAAQHVARLEVDRVDVGEVEDDVLARDGPVSRLAVVVDLQTADLGLFAAGHHQDLLAGLHRAGFQATRDGQGVLHAAPKDIADGHPQRLV